MKKIITLSIILSLFVAGSNFAQSWSTVGNQGMDGSVKCLLTDAANNVVYAGGAFITADGTTVNHIAKWNGTSWSAVGSGFDNTVWALAFHNNELYATGAFTMSGQTPVAGIAKWAGNAWVAVGTGLAFSAVGASLASFGGDLYVGGFFTDAAGVASTKNMAKWNGTSWSAVGGGMQDGVMSLIVYNNALYAGGYFVVNNITFSLQYRIAKLSGGLWVNVGTKGVGDANAYWGVRSMTEYNNDLCVGGYFGMLDNGTTANHAAKWNGSSWSTLGAGANAGITTTASTYVVNASTVYNGTLYVGGTFTGAGGTTANNIAIWNGTAWSAAGTGLDGAANAMAVYNNNLLVAGDFTTAGGTAANRIAKWNEPTASISTVTTKVGAENYPNPFSTSTLITVNREKELQNAELVVYDILGNTVQNLSMINNNRFIFDRNTLTSGIYFYSITENNSQIATGKLVIE